MLKNVVLFLFVCTIPLTLFGQDCHDAFRFTNVIFSEDDIEMSEMPFAQFAPNNLWNSGDTSSACFKPTKYLDLQNDGSFIMSMNVYRAKSSVDPCMNRPVIIYVHGGGYAHLSGAKDDIQHHEFALDAARRGFVIAVINYRKGWDIRDALAKESIPPLLEFPLLPGIQSCACDDGCDPFSFMRITYQMAQDIIAAHSVIANRHVSLGLNPDKIFYWGVSTGAIAAMHAAYGGRDFEDYPDDNGIPLKEYEGSLDAFRDPVITSVPIMVAGVHTLAGAIRDFNWIQADDDVPMMMSHGSVDEAVRYCSGSILNMKYRNSNNHLKHLGLVGPGKIYRQFNCIGDQQTVAHLYTYNGLYHSFTNMPNGTTVANNCNQRDEAREFFEPAFAFHKTIFDDNSLSNEHHRFLNASQNNTDCNIVREDTSTQCNVVDCSQSVAIHTIKSHFNGSVYPNPTNRTLTIEWNQPVSESHILHLKNIDGRLHYSRSLDHLSGQKLSIDVAHLPSGLYVLLLDNQVLRKIVIQRS